MVQRLLAVDTDNYLLPEPVRANLAGADDLVALGAQFTSATKARLADALVPYAGDLSSADRLLIKEALTGDAKLVDFLQVAKAMGLDYTYEGTTGRIYFLGIELGWTGWRKILSWTGGVQDSSNQIGPINTANYTIQGTGDIRIQRHGYVVETYSAATSGNGLVSIGNKNASGGRLITSDTWPDGFRDDIYTAAKPAIAYTTPISIYNLVSGSRFAFLVDPGTELRHMYATYSTRNAWPTVNPGSLGSAPAPDPATV